MPSTSAASAKIRVILCHPWANIKSTEKTEAMVYRDRRIFMLRWFYQWKTKTSLLSWKKFTIFATQKRHYPIEELNPIAWLASGATGIQRCEGNAFGWNNQIKWRKASISYTRHMQQDKCAEGVTLHPLTKKSMVRTISSVSSVDKESTAKKNIYDNLRDYSWQFMSIII